MMTLKDLGWNEAFDREFAPYRTKGWVPARLVRDNRITYGALLDGKDDLQDMEVMLAGRIYHEVKTEAELPAVGDWVALDLAGDGKFPLIQARLARQSCLSRRAVGGSAVEQVIAANVTTVIVVTDAGPDLNLRRLERYLALIACSGAQPVVLVNKCDLYPDAQNQAAAEKIRGLQAKAEVHITSVAKRKGLKALKSYIKPGATIALIGSSGVGKSALVNLILGDEWQWTGEVNELTGKGRHTTSARELMLLPNGGMLVDNPGIKEVHLWTDEKTLRESFSDIEALSHTCQFDDCKHGTDAGCALRAAVATGTLRLARLEAFLKLNEELSDLQQRRQRRPLILARRQKLNRKSKTRERIEFGGERDEY